MVISFYQDYLPAWADFWRRALIGYRDSPQREKELNFIFSSLLQPKLKYLNLSKVNLIQIAMIS